MNYLTHSDKEGFLKQLDLVNKTRSAMVLDEMFGTRRSETVGVRAIIYGSELCGMYDHAPSFEYFTRDAERPVAFPDGIGMAQLRDIAADEFKRYREESDAQQEHHGMFFPMGIRILSAHDEVIDLYKDGRWTIDSDVIPRSQWDDVESEIKRSRSEASIEAGWDNVDTARSLRQQARRLEERLSLSRHSLSTSTLRD